ncbi:MAG: hypothetical protein K9L68_05940 [Spirochaetales bacterium]|nr:hypothetical protein [Spirochaetales bacterium]MCF7938122.1 hypothetical protein [Spirochaetales bacterium]
MIRRIIKRDGRIVPFDRRKIEFAVYQAAVAVGGRDRGRAEKISRLVVDFLERQFRSEQKKSGEILPSVEEVQDAVEKTLIEEGHARTAKAYILYRYEHNLKRKKRDTLSYSQESIPYRKLWEALDWSVEHEFNRIELLNRYLLEDRFEELVDISEDFYRSELSSAAEELRSRLEDLRVIVVAGPSSSGKTTTTNRLGESLEAEGVRFVPINVDNYFFDLETHPQDVDGDYDFETPQALDLELLAEHIRRIIDGEPVDVPCYDFKKGKREGSAGRIHLGERDVLLVDSHHGLYEGLLEGLEQDRIATVYVETLSQIRGADGEFIRWTDIRLMRRMVRDLQFRNYNPLQTIRHWHLVRRSELRYIVSRLKSAQIIINSFLPYELFVLKGRVDQFFPEIIRELEDDPDALDAGNRAGRLQSLLGSLAGTGEESVVPVDSILREFIGSDSS